MIEERILLNASNPPPTPPTKHKNFLVRIQKLFKKVDKGSMRLVIINLMICGTSGTFFLYPVFLRVFGFIPGFFLIFVIASITYITSSFIFEGSSKSGKNDYFNLIRYYLGDKISKIATFTFCLDYFSTYVIGILISYNCFLYVMYYEGFIDKNAVINFDTLEFDMNNKEVTIFRYWFCGAAFFILFPFFLKKSLHGLKLIFLFLISSIVLMILYLFIDLYQFREHYQEIGEYEITLFKKPSLDYIKFFLIFLTAFYIQSNILTVKRDLKNANNRRVKKTIKISYYYFVTFGILFGAWGYFCLGNIHTSDLFMLRASYPKKRFETLYRIILCFFGFFSLIYISFFNLSLRDFIERVFKNPPNFYITSILPLIVAVLICMFYPQILNYLGYNAILSCIPNGFIYPLLIKFQLLKKENERKLFIWFNVFCTILLLVISAVTFVYLIVNDVGGEF